MEIFIDHNKIPRKEWKWNENEIGFEGVNTFDGCLIWFTFRYAHGGNTLSIEQSFEDFLKDGSMKESIPADIMIELYDHVISAVEDYNSGGTKY